MPAKMPVVTILLATVLLICGCTMPTSPESQSQTHSLLPSISVLAPTNTPTDIPPTPSTTPSPTLTPTPRPRATKTPSPTLTPTPVDFILKVGWFTSRPSEKNSRINYNEKGQAVIEDWVNTYAYNFSAEIVGANRTLVQSIRIRFDNQGWMGFALLGGESADSSTIGSYSNVKEIMPNLPEPGVHTAEIAVFSHKDQILKSEKITFVSNAKKPEQCKDYRWEGTTNCP